MTLLALFISALSHFGRRVECVLNVPSESKTARFIEDAAPQGALAALDRSMKFAAADVSGMFQGAEGNAGFAGSRAASSEPLEY